jgi:hypothetical protein
LLSGGWFGGVNVSDTSFADAFGLWTQEDEGEAWNGFRWVAVGPTLIAGTAYVEFDGPVEVKSS